MELRWHDRRQAIWAHAGSQGYRTRWAQNCISSFFRNAGQAPPGRHSFFVKARKRTQNGEILIDILARIGRHITDLEGQAGLFQPREVLLVWLQLVMRRQFFGSESHGRWVHRPWDRADCISL